MKQDTTDSPAIEVPGTTFYAVASTVLIAVLIAATDRSLSGLILFFSLAFQVVLLITIAFQSKSSDNDHSEVDASLSSAVTEASAGANQGDDGVTIDELKARLVECERLINLGQLAAGVAHELNNPLGGILVYSHLLKEDTDADDPRLSNINKIIRESNRLKRIIKSLLDYARQSQPYLAESDMNAVLIDALDNIRHDHSFVDIEIKEELSEDLPPVMADSSQIQEVFENIIRNAAEVMPGEGEILIRSRLMPDAGESPWVELTIADTGPGISDELKTHMFDPFYTTKLKGHGTGLGLAVSYGIIERHKGTIEVSNRNGGGAEFTVRLMAGGNA